MKEYHIRFGRKYDNISNNVNVYTPQIRNRPVFRFFLNSTLNEIFRRKFLLTTLLKLNILNTIVQINF